MSQSSVDAPSWNSDVDREELRSRALQLVSVFLASSAAVGFLCYLPGPVFYWRELAALLLVSITGVLAWRMRKKHPQRSEGLLLVGPILSLAFSLAMIRNPALPFFAVLIPLANSVLDPRRGLVATGLSTLAILTFRPAGDMLWPSLTVLWSVAVLASISLRESGTVLDRALNSERRAAELVNTLRLRQGELNRTLRALDEAFDRLKRTNDELAAARWQAEEAKAFKEQFVANVSHEIRTPLSLVVGFAEMMYLAPETYEGVVWTPELESDLKELYRASRHLQSLVNDVLDLSRIDAARLPMFREFIDICAVIGEATGAIATLIRRRGLALSVECPGDLPRLFVDRTRIRQVLLNLLNNALRYTDEGAITIRVEETEEAVVIKVQDTGIGIPEEQIGHVFDRFSPAAAGPRSRGGAGLGLALCRQFVRLHGGEMRVTSTPGHGSSFCFSLPLPGAVHQFTPLQRTRQGFQPEPKMPIVVIDADPSVADMLNRYLSDHPVLAARNDSEADILVGSEHPLAVVVNHTPDAPEQEWLGALGQACVEFGVPVVNCSIPSSSWRAQSLGLDDCITKPASREALRAALDRHCPNLGMVLVVDDDPAFLELMTRTLRAMAPGYEVIVANSGTQALRLARANRPQLVFLDLLMPEMSGFDVLSEMKRDASLQDVPVVAISATSYADELEAQHPGRFTVQQSRGMTGGKVVDLLNAMLDVLQPDYAVDATTSLRA